MHKSQVLLCFLLAFIVGVAIGSFISVGPMVAMVVFGIGAMSVILFWRRDWRIVVAGCALVFLVFGIWRIQTTQLLEGILTQFGDTKVEVTLKGYIAKEPEISSDKQKLVLAVREYSVPGYANVADEGVLINLGLYPQYQYGQRVVVTGVLNLPYFQDGDFDYQKYLAKDGIYTTMFNPEIASVEIDLAWSEKLKISFLTKIFEFKNLFEGSIERSIVEPNASFINGILLGSRSQIPEDLKDAFARTSMSHVLAISGFNITIIAEIICAFFLLFVRRPTAFWFSLVAVILFTIMTGAQAAVVRAAIMGILILLARKEGRAYNVHNAIILAAAVMIYFNPMILRNDVGFQLSFAATMGLVFISPRIEKYFEKVPELFKLKETFIMSVSAQIMVLPLILHYFENLSIMSLPANLLVLPSIPYAMLLGFVTGVAGMIWPWLGQLVGYFTWLLSTIEIGIVKTLARPSFAAVAISFNWILVVLAYIIIVLYIRHGRKSKSQKSQ